MTMIMIWMMMIWMTLALCYGNSAETVRTRDAVQHPNLLLNREEKDGWRLVFSDDFNRPSIGANWRWVFVGSRHYVADKALHLNFNSMVSCRVPLPHPDARVEMDLMLPSASYSDANKARIILTLRGGEFDGGNDERLEVTLVPTTRTAADPPESYRITPDQTFHVVMQVSGGTGTVEIAGKVALQKPVVPPQSEINRYFTFATGELNRWDDARLSNFKIWAGPQSVDKLPLRPNTAEENRQATRKASDFIDPANPAIGIQKAIDSLPPSGGVVILPEGEFVMRRHLLLRNNVTLRGQGAGKTILKADTSAEVASIQAIASDTNQSVVTVSAADAAKFRVGDAVRYDEVIDVQGNRKLEWTNPSAYDWVNRDLVITAIANNQLTVRGQAPGVAPHYTPIWMVPLPADAAPTKIQRFFPGIYAHCAEFVDVKDLTIVGGPGDSTFDQNAITFGQIAGARISRINVPQWQGDGISMQTLSDAIVSDSTVSNSWAGFHPGGITHRFMWSRNRSVGNRSSGLYFCWYNQNGIYYRNTLDHFFGLGWPRDTYNVIERNSLVSTTGFLIEQSEGGGGVVFNNQAPLIQVGHGQNATAPTYDFLVATNRADKLQFVAGDVRRKMFVGNLNCAGSQPTTIAQTPADNFFSTQGIAVDLSRFPVGCERTDPVGPPSLPMPILDGATFYQPDKPDAGFQAALDQLAGTGGTLLLPGGRYGLSQALVVPSGVTLAGQGMGTVLHAARPEQTNSMIVVNQADQSTIRDLVILGEYEQRAFREPAILLQNAKKAEVVAVDVRGWEGTAVKVTGGAVETRDCRALGCAGNGFEFAQSQVNCVGNIARDCANGFVVSQASASSLLEANIASGNRGNGFQIEQSPGIWVYANNANYNHRDGITVAITDNADIVANMLVSNNQLVTDGCGIRLGGNTKNCRVFYNNLQDDDNLKDQPSSVVEGYPTQTNAIVEEATAGNNLIRFNLSRAPIQAGGRSSTVSDNFKP